MSSETGSGLPKNIEGSINPRLHFRWDRGVASFNAAVAGARVQRRGR